MTTEKNNIAHKDNANSIDSNNTSEIAPQKISDIIPEIEQMDENQKTLLKFLATVNIVGFSGEPFYEDLVISDDNGEERTVSDQAEIMGILQNIFDGNYLCRLTQDGCEEIVIPEGESIRKNKNPIQTILKEYSSAVLNPTNSLLVLSYFNNRTEEIGTVTNQENYDFSDTQDLITPLGASRIELFEKSSVKENMRRELLPYLNEERVLEVLESIKDEKLATYLAEIINTKETNIGGLFLKSWGGCYRKLHLGEPDQRVPGQVIYYTREKSSMMDQRGDPIEIAVKRSVPGYRIEKKDFLFEEPSSPSHIIRIFNLIKK